MNNLLKKIEVGEIISNLGWIIGIKNENVYVLKKIEESIKVKGELEFTINHYIKKEGNLVYEKEDLFDNLEKYEKFLREKML